MMDSNMSAMIILAIFLLFLGLFVVVYTVTILKKQQGTVTTVVQEKNSDKKEARCSMEFSKIMLLTVLGMWVFGGVVGFWVVIFSDSSMLMNILDYIETPVMTGIGVYGAKSGVENWKKLSTGASTVGQTSENAEKSEESVGTIDEQ